MRKEIDIQLLKNIIIRHDGIISAYLSGSAQSGIVPGGSDIDIALRFKQKPGIMQLAEIRADLQSELHFENVDISVLNEASPILRYEALCGRRLFADNEDDEACFASLTAREYEDEMGMLERVVSL